MKNKLILIILCSFIMSCTTAAQVGKIKNIENSISLFTLLGNKNFDYNLEFIENKETLYLTYIINGKKFGYRFTLSDMHPEGIFIFTKNNERFLRILSIQNHKVFIYEKFIREFRNSNNTNIIDIPLPPQLKSRVAEKLVNSMKAIVKKDTPEVENIEVEPPRTKN